jgi:hypothetical protein
MKSYVKYYWAIFIVYYSICIMLLLDGDVNTDYIRISFIVVWIAIGIIVLIENGRFTTYMRKHHTEVWEKLPFVISWGSDYINPIRLLPFLYSKENYNDALLKLYKTNNRRTIILLFVVFICLIVLNIVMDCF